MGKITQHIVKGTHIKFKENADIALLIKCDKRMYICVFNLGFNMSVYSMLSLWPAKYNERRTQNLYSAILNHLLRSCENECIGYALCSNANRTAVLAMAANRNLLVVCQRFGIGKPRLDCLYRILWSRCIQTQHKHILATDAC